MSETAELLQLLETEIPECRRSLQDSHANLEKVAAYCEGNYIQAADKTHALDETKCYTTQSLASVAYQINMLATNFLRLLDLQMGQISDMESNINHLSQIVMIHKEKVARREIGELTTNKSSTKPPGVKNPGIIFPEQQERPLKYVRKNIDYTTFDDLGHGVRQQNMTSRRNSSGSSTGSKPSLAAPPTQAPTTRPPTPPSMYGSGGGGGGGSGTLRKASSPYRTPAPPVSPPLIPSNYAPNYPIQAPSAASSMGSLRKSGYASGNMASVGQQQPAQIMRAMSGMGTPQAGTVMSQSQLYDRDSVVQYISDPVLISGNSMYRSSQMGNMSPPLPPPPGGEIGDGHFGMHGGQAYEASGYGEAMHNYDRTRMNKAEEAEADWVPAKFIEKVVAIYSYTQDKDDELTFDEGAVIYVVKKNDDGWWEGVMDGHTGLFPGNYVEPCI